MSTKPTCCLECGVLRKDGVCPLCGGTACHRESYVTNDEFHSDEVFLKCRSCGKEHFVFIKDLRAREREETLLGLERGIEGINRKLNVREWVM